MTLSEYRSAVREFFEIEGVDALFATGDEGFLWHSCEVCASPLGGMRHTMAGIAAGERVEYRACTTCLFYLVYGEVEDGLFH